MLYDVVFCTRKNNKIFAMGTLLNEDGYVLYDLLLYKYYYWN